MENTVTYLKLRRRQCVQILYKLFILDENVSKMHQEILDGTQIEPQDQETEEYLLDVLTNFENLKEIVEPLLSKSWNWGRLANVIKAILINGAYEIVNKVTQKAIVIDESIEMVREFLPSWDTTFINAVLDKVN